MKRCLKCSSCFDSSDWICPECGSEPFIKNGFRSFAPKLDATEEGFDPSAFPHIRALEDNNFWFRARNHLIAWSINKYFSESRKFFEVGCGTGFVLSDISNRFPHLECHGSEIQTAGLKFARSRIGDVPLWQMDAKQIPFKSEFDLIGAFDVLEHIKEDETVLNQFHQALKPSGGLVLTVPQHPFLWSRVDEMAHHERRYTKEEMLKKLESAGFKIVKSTSFVSFLLPIMMVSRFTDRATEAEPDAEFSMPDSINSLFGAVMKLEIACIKTGIRFPAGGSLLVVAQKKN